MTDTPGTPATSAEADPDLSYEEARDRLVEVVRTLEQGGTSLAESLALWEQGEELAKVCQRALEGARERLDRALGPDGPDGPDGD
ncbi:MAG: exodeoxyribonuclease small subunit [Marmoricola sp.]|nr:exodeoxyribonuclease small subunit [Marmoricola sp.]